MWVCGCFNENITVFYIIVRTYKCISRTNNDLEKYIIWYIIYTYYWKVIIILIRY